MDLHVDGLINLYGLDTLFCRLLTLVNGQLHSVFVVTKQVVGFE